MSMGYPSIDKPWLKYYDQEAIEGPLPECTIYEYMRENNDAYPRDVAMNYCGGRITYEELFQKIDRAAKGFLALGVKPGDVVTVALPSIPEALYAIYALNKVGAVSNVIHPLAGAGEITDYLNEVESTAAVLYTGTYDLIKDSIDNTRIERAVVVSAGDSLSFGIRHLYQMRNGKLSLPRNSKFMSWGQLEELGSSVSSSSIAKDCDTVAIISHTGGTTGEPKGVMLSDRNINAIIWQISKILPIIRQERQLVVLPPFVNYSLVNSMLEPIALGNTAILIPNYDPSKFVDYAQKYKPTYVSSIPPYWEALLKANLRKSLNLSFLKYPFYGGEAMSADVEDAVNQQLRIHGAPNALAKGLGATELVSAATLTPYDRNLLESVGLPLPKVNCKIVQPGSDNELHYGEEGEICFAGPTVMLGYFNNPAATSEIVKVHSDGDRWLHTGDLGCVDEQGNIFVTGRIKRIMITRGPDGASTKMFPDRIEKAVLAHSSVDLCCVVGVPDEARINYPKAIVVLGEGVERSESLTQDIIGVCRAALPDYLVPMEIEYRADLPRTERGKVDFRALEREAGVTDES